MIGDVVGEPGLEALETRLPEILKNNNVDFAVVNGENAADGFGMTEATFRRILAAGADVVTSGNHVWEKRDFWDTLETAGQLLRPANYPAGSPGQGWLCVEKAGVSWVIINLQGREFMNVIDCPFRCFDTIVQGIGNSVLAPVTLVDFHAESAREKESLGHYLDGRSSVVAGTHTHVQTADERVLPKGTAYISDLGMTGITASVIGMDTKICLDRMRKQVLYRMEPAARNDTTVLNIQGIIAEINGDTGTAISIKRIQN
jgi:metallophosphoesterase (TIGR00282 family)